MRFPRTFLLALLPLLTLAGCTLYRAKNPGTLKTTTSVEQIERILWQAAVKKDYSRVTDLISSQAVFVSRDGGRLTREQFLEHLKSVPLGDYAIGQVAVKGQGNDTVLTYPASVRDASASGTAGLTILSVWQQTRNSGWTLIAHTETPASVPLK